MAAGPMKIALFARMLMVGALVDVDRYAHTSSAPGVRLEERLYGA